MVDWIGLAIPFAYLAILIGSLATFSSLYRKRKSAKAASLAPWFPPHLQKNIYLTLLHLEPDPSEGNKNPKVPDSVLKAALLRRAVEDIHRIVQVRNAKPALQALVQRGSVGDETWQRLLRAEQEIEEELRDVVNEANAFSPNWGATIFQTANEMANNALLRQKIAEIQAQVPSEKEWWERRKASIQSDFMKELEDDSLAAKDKGAPAVNSKTSDDDAVLVEGGGPAVGGQGSGKRKKGKK